MIRILAVHGIATPLAYALVERWGKALRAHSFDVSIQAARWASTGSAAKDLYRIATSRAFVDDAIEAVVDAITPRRFGVDFILAHSFGEPLVCCALREIGASIPVLSIGSPRTNPVFAALLKARELDKPPRGPVLAVTNSDDFVSTSRLLGARVPTWIEHERISLAGNLGGIVEHDAERYLAHPSIPSFVSRVLK